MIPFRSALFGRGAILDDAQFVAQRGTSNPNTAPMPAGVQAGDFAIGVGVTGGVPATDGGAWSSAAIGQGAYSWKQLNAPDVAGNLALPSNTGVTFYRGCNNLVTRVTAGATGFARSSGHAGLVAILYTRGTGVQPDPQINITAPATFTATSGAATSLARTIAQFHRTSPPSTPYAGQNFTISASGNGDQIAFILELLR